MPRVIFPQWTPDQPSMAKGLQVATNVYPAPLGYRPVLQWESLTEPLPGKCLGAASFVSRQGAVSVIAGTDDTLYRWLPTGWDAISTGYSIVLDGRWRFAQFGDLAIATNGTDPMVKIDLAAFTGAPLGGTPPRAKLLAVVKDFVVGGVIDDDEMMVQWSGINNAEFWTPAQNQSDYQIMPTGGEVTGLFGGEVGIILQRGRISRMTYVGDNLVFQFDEISYNMGCVSRHSTAQAGVLGFFRSDNGFMMWTGAELKPIGYERVDRTFAASYSRPDWKFMSTAVDMKNNLVCWAMADRQFIYNWVLDRWSVIEQPSTIVFSGFTRDLTLEEVGEMFPDIDLMALSLDADEFKGGNPAFYTFNDENEMGWFAGGAMEASLELGDMEFVAGRESRISQVRPLTDAIAGITLSVEARARLGDAAVANEYDYLTDNGEMPVRESGRLIKLGLEYEAGADWTYAQGLDVGIAGGLARGGRR